MSRYRSHRVNKASIGYLIEGQIDILVGTHRYSARCRAIQRFRLAGD